jgi:predicted nucleic acid-binding Zn ribbon protein
VSRGIPAGAIWRVVATADAVSRGIPAGADWLVDAAELPRGRAARPAAGSRMRRRAPRPLGVALDRLTSELAPRTLLAEVQRAWTAAAGEAVAAQCTPDGEREGVVTVACASAVWAQELDLLSERVVERLNEQLGRPAVRALKPQPRPPRA